MAKEFTSEELGKRTFVITLVCVGLFIASVFLFIL